MKCDLTPRIIRLPKPSIVRVNPMSAITIGTPAGRGRIRGVEARAITRHINPRSVGRQLIVEIIKVNFRCRRRRRVRSKRLRRGNKGRSGPIVLLICRWRDRWRNGRPRIWISRGFCLQQRGDHRLGNSLAVKIKNVVGAQGIRCAGIPDISDNHIICHVRLGQLYHLLQSGREIRRGSLRAASIAGIPAQPPEGYAENSKHKT